MNIIISPEIWFEATRSTGGPAAKLMNALVADPKIRDANTVFACQWVADQLKQMMLEGGYQEKQAADQAQFILDLSEVLEIPADAERPLVELAKAAGVDTIYFAGGSYEDADGVHFAPVHELMTALGMEA